MQKSRRKEGEHLPTGPKPRVDHSVVWQLVREQGLTPLEAAERTGLTRQGVHYAVRQEDKRQGWVGESIPIERRPKWPEAEIARMWYEEQLPTAEVLERAGITYPTLVHIIQKHTRALRDAGQPIPVRLRKEGTFAHLRKFDHDQAAQRLLAGTPPVQVAREMGVTVSAVRGMIRRRKLQLAA